MKPFLIRNRDGDKLSDKLNEFIDTEGLKEILITTGYWDLKGTACIASKLRTFLEKDDARLKLIIGDQPKINEWELKDKIFDTFIKLDEIDYKNESYQDACELILEYCKAGKIEIRLHKKSKDSSFLHAKCYIFKSDSDNSIAITGSGNFTLKGLNYNHELNYIDYDSSHITSSEGYESWFNCEWEESTNWKMDFLQRLTKHDFYKYIQKSKKSNTLMEESELPVNKELNDTSTGVFWNEEHQTYNIRFDGAPNKEILEKIKKEGWSWIKKYNYWYPRTNDALKNNQDFAKMIDNTYFHNNNEENIAL